MNGLTLILEILKYVIPSLVVLFTAIYLIKMFLENDQKKRIFELKLSNHKIITPVRLQACERLIMLLERILPENLILRVNQAGMTAAELHGSLLKNIRDEFDHNLSQQLYISSLTWDLIRGAREEMVRIINTAFAQAGENADASIFAMQIFKIVSELPANPVIRAQKALKDEIKNYL